ncbi:Trypsin precursor [Grimontia celer]|uniref:Trypsin n=1 Tax=Grimontia celer TaxID=1796497 RepID=A0A128F9T2_9GAMM|nr:serine protease [Grimontia celer]CZF83066.1 Trypsin precursor [Grimontia celer]
MSLALASLLHAQAFASQSNVSAYILNGSDTDIQDVPWQAYVESHALGYASSCGGSVIKDVDSGEARWVLTAAHCMDVNVADIYRTLPDSADDVFVSTGVADKGDAEFKRRAVQAKTVYIHKDWDKESNDMYSDIALIELHSPVSEPAKAIALASDSVQQDYDSSAENTKHSPNRSQLISGYGHVNPKVSKVIMLDRLQAVYTYAITDKQCQQEFNTFANRGAYIPNMLNDENAFICAGAKDMSINDPTQQIGAFQGDSGGPMVWENPSDNTKYLMGITSWGGNHLRSGYRCGLTSTVYTQVSTYKNWIEQCMIGNCQDANVIKSSTTQTLTPEKPDAVTPAKPSNPKASDGALGAVTLCTLLLLTFRRREKRIFHAD